MALVSESALYRIKEAHRSAIATDSYSAGYHRAIRALSEAIGMLEQLQMINGSVTLVVEK